VFGPIALGNVGAVIATTTRIAVRLSLRYALENEVPILPVAPVRHVEIER